MISKQRTKIAFLQIHFIICLAEEDDYMLFFYSNSLLTEPSAPTARPPAGGSLRSPTPPAARFARPNHSLMAKKFGAIKKNLKKNQKKI